MKEQTALMLIAAVGGALVGLAWMISLKIRRRRREPAPSAPFGTYSETGRWFPPGFNAAQIAYGDDDAARVTCPHLRPLEDAVRSYGYECRLVKEVPPEVFAFGAMEPEPRGSAIEALGLGPSVVYLPSERTGPHEESDPAYRCTLCDQKIGFSLGYYGGDPQTLVIAPRA